MINYEQKMRDANHVFVLEALHIKDENGRPEFVEFLPYIENISENYDSSWDEQDVYGRMDGIHTFKGVKRNISLSLKIAAANVEQAKQNQEKLGKMIRFLYPAIGTNIDSIGANNQIKSNYIKSAPILRLKFGNIIKDVVNDTGLYGIIKGGISITPSHIDGWFQGEDIKIAPLISGFAIAGITAGTTSGMTTPRIGAIVADIAGVDEAAAALENSIDKNRELLYYKYFIINFTFTVLHNHVLGNENENPNENYFNTNKFPYGLSMADRVNKALSDARKDREQRETAQLLNSPLSNDAVNEELSKNKNGNKSETSDKINKSAFSSVFGAVSSIFGGK